MQKSEGLTTLLFGRFTWLRKTIPDLPFVFRGFSPATGTVFFNEIKYMYKACTSKFFSSAPGY